MPEHFWIETLGCPKNQVDSEKIAGSLLADGYVASSTLERADMIVVNTCAFIDAARRESVQAIDDALKARRTRARVVVTGCLAARAGAEIAASFPEVDFVADVGVPVSLGVGPRWRPGDQRRESHSMMELPRSHAGAPWAYVKIAEGCDRKCGFSAIPSFRGPQASRTTQSILKEIDDLDVREVVLVAQDLASYGNDRGSRHGLAQLVAEAKDHVERLRMLYLYPSALTDELCASIVATGVSYFDLSLQHVAAPLLRRMRRFGGKDRFLQRIGQIRELDPQATFRSSFILGYPGETEEDHDELLEFLSLAELDWVGFFAYSKEDHTYAAGLADQIPRALALERMRECSEVQDAITSRKRRSLIGTSAKVLVDAKGRARSPREAPEIDGIIRVDESLLVGEFFEVDIVAAEGPDLVATSISREVPSRNSVG